MQFELGVLKDQIKIEAITHFKFGPANKSAVCQVRTQSVSNLTNGSYCAEILVGVAHIWQP